jgi:hypothetical protein
MPQNTHVALATIQPSGLATSVVMDSIPSTYTDLVLVCNYPQSSAGSGRIYFNNDNTSGLYSQTVSYANAAGTTSGGRETSANHYFLMDYVSSSTTTSNMSIVNIMSYARTDRFKTVLETAGASDKGNVISVGCWRNTNAITRIDITAAGGTFSSGASITLYGIKNWGNETTPKATGGYVYSDSTYWYHAFPFSSTFTPNQSITADILVVAGGGSGGGAYFGPVGAGGGAGGMQTFTSQSLTATNYTCTVGAGGTKSITNIGENTSGGNSQFGSLTASVGGGAGGEFNNNRSAGTGANGGSGGGGAGNNGSGGGLTAATGTSGQGNNGGTGGNTDGSGAGGGGGKGAVGANRSGQNGGAGGIGATTSISGGSATTFGHLVDGSYYFAGGGGGGFSNAGGIGAVGGAGGGGLGGRYGTNGLVSTGGGGGGGANLENFTGSNGGSGIIIVRYTKA